MKTSFFLFHLVVLLHSPYCWAAGALRSGSSNIEDISSSTSQQEERLIEPDFCLCSCQTEDDEDEDGGVLMLAEDGDLIEQMDGMYSFCTSHSKSEEYVSSGKAKCERDCENYDDYLKMLQHYLKATTNRGRSL